MSTQNHYCLTVFILTDQVQGIMFSESPAMQVVEIVGWQFGISSKVVEKTDSQIYVPF